MLERLYGAYETLWTFDPTPLYGPRSSQWSKVRDEYLKEHPLCAACGTEKLPNIHHIVPYHVDKSLELDPSNLMTLCEYPSHYCHFVFGHLMNWSSYNPSVVVDAAKYFSRIRTRP